MSEELPITEAELQAYADGRLIASRRAEVDAWLASRPEEAERIAAYRRVSEELQAFYDPVLAEPAPETLERAASGKPHSHGGRSWRAAALAAGAAVIAAGLGAVAGSQLHAMRAAPPPLADNTAIARPAAVAHALYSPV